MRSLPRVFVSGLPDPLVEAFELPDDEYDKFHKVLRLGSGDQVAVLPGDGRLVRCRLQGREAVPEETCVPETEAPLRLTLALGLPKPEKLEESLRMATELGVAEFIVFPADRSVVRWDAAKLSQRMTRLERIAREAAEVSFRTRLPALGSAPSLKDLVVERPEAVVLSEGEGVTRPLAVHGQAATLVVGPEGGWSPREVAVIGERAVTLGPRVLRVDTAVAAACAIALCPDGREGLPGL